MTQFCCYRVWDGSLEKFRRTVVLMSIFDLVVISAVITFVGISLYHVSYLDPPSNTDADDNSTSILSDPSDYNDTLCAYNEEMGRDGEDCLSGKYLNHTITARFFPVTPFFQVVGAMIANSIQLIMYTVQLLVTVFMIRGLMQVDTHCMRTWLIVTEIITTIILLILILYLFGDFKADTVLTLGAYVIYQVIMIRTVARLIRRTEIELTQFGSVVEF